MKIARIGVLLDETAAKRRWHYGLNVFERYIGEVLGHAGITFQWVNHSRQIEKMKYDILIVALASEDEYTASEIMRFANNGGTVISYGGLNRLAVKLQYEEIPALNVGYANVNELNGESSKLRFLSARPWQRSTGAEGEAVEFGQLHQHTPDGDVVAPALVQVKVGKGEIHRWSVEIPATIVGFQQGSKPVLEDGINAPDGSAVVKEGILKADDRCEFDWELDRAQTETGAIYFDTPHADLWREQVIAHLLKCAVAMELPLPFMGYWPEGVQGVAHISHDSDMNLDVYAESTLAILAECEVNSTWCMLEPGYSPPIYEKIKAAGHELAFHYNALPEQAGHWSEEEFNEQLNWLKNDTGESVIKSNKNHYTRFEGFGELFEWCERAGIECDQTRGTSKRGNVGFLFGTCHPYFPIAWSNDSNRMYNVIELPFLTQDMNLQAWSDSSIIAPFLAGVERVNGVAHFLFHQIHVHNWEEVREAFRELVQQAKAKGFVFWTAARINDWERLKRSLIISGMDDSGQAIVRRRDHSPLNNGEAAAAEGALVVWIPVSDSDVRAASAEMKFGIPCVRQVVALD